MGMHNGQSEIPLESILTPILGDDEMVLQAVAIIVGMDKEGKKWLSHYRSTDLRTWEARGMVEDLRDTLSGMATVRFFLEEDDGSDPGEVET